MQLNPQAPAIAWGLERGAEEIYLLLLFRCLLFLISYAASPTTYLPVKVDQQVCLGSEPPGNRTEGEGDTHEKDLAEDQISYRD